MAAKRKSSFITSKEKTVSITSRISESLNNRVVVIQDELKEVNPDLKFCTATIISRAIELAVKDAEVELQTMREKSNEPPKTKPKLDQLTLGAQTNQKEEKIQNTI